MSGDLSVRLERQILKIERRNQILAEEPISGNCVFCNRVLTDPRSVELGIGPECEKWYLNMQCQYNAGQLRGISRLYYEGLSRTLKCNGIELKDDGEG